MWHQRVIWPEKTARATQTTGTGNSLSATAEIIAAPTGANERIVIDDVFLGASPSANNGTVTLQLYQRTGATDTAIGPVISFDYDGGNTVPYQDLYIVLPKGYSARIASANSGGSAATAVVYIKYHIETIR